MKVKTSELEGKLLNQAVAYCVEQSKKFPMFFDGEPMSKGDYITDWALAGPIIEREGINIEFDPDVPQWFASYDRGEVVCGYSGLMPLIAAMRCYVASKLGDEVEVPNEMVA
jgi:hypothetical protein